MSSVPLLGPVHPCYGQCTPACYVIVPVASAVISLTLSCSMLGAGAGRAKLRVLGPALAAAITAVVDNI